MAITNFSLREVFPADYHKRCMYASFGLSALLRDGGIPARIVGGDFICAVISKDGSRMSLQGFGASTGGTPSHYWVEAQEMLLDLGPMYLPYDSSFPASPLPVLRWPATSKLPDFVAYRERIRYAEEVKIDTPEFFQKNAEFVARCREVARAQNDPISLGTWELSDMQSLRQAAAKGDSWARAALEFIRRSLKARFPF